MKQIFADMEIYITDVVGNERIKKKEMRMLKGTVKKWQVLDDGTYDREEISKIQAAVKAPLPDELDFYKEKHDKTMKLPITNANVYEWRDEKQAIDTADFDPRMIQYDRERRKNFYLDRYEKPKELAEH